MLIVKKKTLLVTGAVTALYRQMLATYLDSVAPGTLANRLTQAKLLVV